MENGKDGSPIHPLEDRPQGRSTGKNGRKIFENRNGCGTVKAENQGKFESWNGSERFGFKRGLNENVNEINGMWRARKDLNL